MRPSGCSCLLRCRSSCCRSSSGWAVVVLCFCRCLSCGFVAQVSSVDVAGLAVVADQSQSLTDQSTSTSAPTGTEPMLADVLLAPAAEVHRCLDELSSNAADAVSAVAALTAPITKFLTDFLMINFLSLSVFLSVFYLYYKLVFCLWQVLVPCSFIYGGMADHPRRNLKKNMYSVSDFLSG